MSKIVNVYEWKFDFVDFALDLKAARMEAKLTQREVAEAYGFTGGWLSNIEVGHKDDRLTLAVFLSLCNQFDLHPQKYIVIERAD